MITGNKNRIEKLGNYPELCMNQYKWGTWQFFLNYIFGKLYTSIRNLQVNYYHIEKNTFLKLKFSLYFLYIIIT